MSGARSSMQKGWVWPSLTPRVVRTNFLRVCWAQTLGHRFPVAEGFATLWLLTWGSGNAMIPTRCITKPRSCARRDWRRTLPRIETQVVGFITCSISSGFTFARWAALTLRTLRLCIFNAAEFNNTLGRDWLNFENVKLEPESFWPN